MNGHFAGFGPSRGDIQNWQYETLDIALWLTSGRNVIAAEVWNFSGQRPQAQISYGDASLVVQGNGSAESVVNTGDSWKVARNKGFCMMGKPRGTTAGPGEQLSVGDYPWGWQQTDFDDSQWEQARRMSKAVAKGTVDYMGRLLVPSPLPQMERSRQAIPSENITIPANTKKHIVFNQGVLTTGYPAFCFSGGRGATMDIKYVEAYYSSDPKTHEKGDRREIEGKVFQGHRDKIYPDGSAGRSYETLWWRTWRYIDIDIETKDEPMTIDSIYSYFSAYPFERRASLTTEKQQSWLGDVLDIGWRTARLCARDMYMDCPYYEQLQYFGDTRIQAMVTLYNTTDDRLPRLAIEQGRRSLIADGLTLSRYPSVGQQIIPPFSLWWIGMAYDYWMMRGDEDFLRQQLPALRQVLSWWLSYLMADHSLKKTPYWFFIDWAKGFDYGAPARPADGHSAMQDVLLITALQQVAEMERVFGIVALGEYYNNVANDMCTAFRILYLDESRQLFAETPEHKAYSQHTNVLALLAGLATDDAEAKIVMQHVVEDSDLTQATIYFRYYVNYALGRFGLGDRLLDQMQMWRDQMAIGLTTWAETPEPSRSDCHAWGCSPNVKLFRTLLGISPSSPAFKTVRIAPSLGEVRKISGTMPHPQGDISVNYSLSRRGNLTAIISLPQNVTGTFVWQGKEYQLHEG